MESKSFGPVALFATLGLFVVAVFVTCGTDAGRTATSALGEAVLHQGDVIAGVSQLDAPQQAQAN
jgi:hypothetical protein